MFQTVEVETPRAVKVNFGNSTDMWFPKTTQDGRHISSLVEGSLCLRVEDWYFKKNFHKLSATNNWRC